MSQKNGAKKNQKRSSGRSTPILVVIILLAVLIIGGGLFIVMTKFGPKEDVEGRVALLEQQYSSDVQVIVGRVQSALHDKVGTTRVFNRQNRLMFMFRNTTGVAANDALPDEFQQEFKKALFPTGSATRLTIEGYSAATKERSTALETLLSSSIGVKAAEAYCEDNMATMTSDAYFIVGRALEEQFTEQDLLAYCAATAEFAHIKGVQAAAMTLFGKALKDCNQWQQHYLVATYQDPDISWDEWRANVSFDNSIPTSVDSGLMRDSTLSQQMLRQRIQEELRDILGTRLSREDFDVEVMIDENVQRDLQKALDDSLAQSVSMQSDGNTSLDGCAIVFTPGTGLVSAFVSGRSINSSAKEFVLHEQSHLGVYRAALDIFDADTGVTYNTLVPYTTADGLNDYISMRSLLSLNRLDLLHITPSLESTVTLQELEKFSRSLFDDSGEGAKFVKQVVKTGSNEVVYTADSANSVADEFGRQNIRKLFWEDGDSMYSMYVEEYTSGKAFASWSDANVVCGLVGSDALGYGVTEQDNDLMMAAIPAMVQAMRAYFKFDENTYEPFTGYDAVYDVADVKNQEVVKALVDGYIQDLETRVINSKESRLAFEGAYTDYLATVSRYSDVVNTVFLKEQTARIEAMRASRADELLAYVA